MSIYMKGEAKENRPEKEPNPCPCHVWSQGSQEGEQVGKFCRTEKDRKRPAPFPSAPGLLFGDLVIPMSRFEGVHMHGRVSGEKAKAHDSRCELTAWTVRSGCCPGLAREQVAERRPEHIRKRRQGMPVSKHGCWADRRNPRMKWRDWLRCQGGVYGQCAEVRKEASNPPADGVQPGLGRPPGLHVDRWQVDQARAGSETFLPGNHL